MTDCIALETNVNTDVDSCSLIQSRLKVFPKLGRDCVWCKKDSLPCSWSRAFLVISTDTCWHHVESTRPILLTKSWPVLVLKFNVRKRSVVQSLLSRKDSFPVYQLKPWKPAFSSLNIFSVVFEMRFTNALVSLTHQKVDISIWKINTDNKWHVIYYRWILEGTCDMQFVSIVVMHNFSSVNLNLLSNLAERVIYYDSNFENSKCNLLEVVKSFAIFLQL